MSTNDSDSNAEVEMEFSGTEISDLEGVKSKNGTTSDLDNEMENINAEDADEIKVSQELMDQRSIINKMIKECEEAAKEGDVVYIIPKQWLDRFYSEVVTSIEEIGPIDVSSIVRDREHFVLQDYNEVPYVSIAEPLYLKFEEWYGILGNTKPVTTYIIRDKNTGLLNTEYNKCFFRVHHLVESETPKRNYMNRNVNSYFVLSVLNTIQDMATKALEIFFEKETQFDIDNSEIRLWFVSENYGNTDTEKSILANQYEISPLQFLGFSKRERITKDNFLVQLKNLDIQNNDILIEVKNEVTGTWPSLYYIDNKPAELLGTVGLTNLGNTCYMNSALQCLVHIPQLRDYFFYDGFQSEVNLDNPLGYNGTVAKAFSHLIQNLYSPVWVPDKANAYSPNNFKMTLGHVNSMFSGYMQQDSQEFLAFLLDSLHEDLNRIVKKPYIEKPSLEMTEEMVDAKAVSELAQKTWETHLARNDSVINDLFVALYKSTLKCPVCENVSITFDPYNDLTLPLPVHTVWKKMVKIFPQNSPPCVLEIELPKSSTYQDLKSYIASLANVDIADLYGCEIFNYQFYNNFESAESNSLYLPIQELISESDDIVFYEILTNPGDIIVPIINTKIEDGYNIPSFFGVPFFLALSPEERLNPFAIYHKLEKLYTNLSGGYIQFPETIDNSKNPLDSFPMIGEKYDSDLLQNFETILKDAYEPSQDHLFSVKKITSNYSMTSNGDQNRPIFWTPQGQLSIKQGIDLLESASPILKDIMNYSQFKDNKIESFIENDALEKQEGEEVGDDMGEQNPSSILDDTKLPNINLATFENDRGTTDALTEIVYPEDILVCEWTNVGAAEAFTDDKPFHWENPARLENKELEKIQKERNETTNKNITLDECLKLFSKPEVLGISDSWYCPKCKDHRQATKQLELWNTPDILLIHLKRFENQRSFSDKIDVTVEFPIEGLDVSPYIVNTMEQKGTIYDLFAVDNHYGGLGGGHYTAYAKNETDGKWYYFNDSRVSLTDPMQSISGSAYLLFYARRGCDMSETSDSKLSLIIQESRKAYQEQWQKIMTIQESIYEELRTDDCSKEIWRANKTSPLDSSGSIDNSSDKEEIMSNNKAVSDESTESEIFSIQPADIRDDSNEDDSSRKSTDYSTESLEVGNLDLNENGENSGRRKLRLLKKVYENDTPSDDDAAIEEGNDNNVDDTNP
ncbi:Uncharacterized protein RNJ44_01051 [Nakaseomyces bracarensis]|uniref:ubiquitinyl hydrolase 1 n=1 Tax=Nakaseomyces bracarensis TaxID=273131 RepID=A0ABR4NQV7_9SACH